MNEGNGAGGVWEVGSDLVFHLVHGTPGLQEELEPKVEVGIIYLGAKKGYWETKPSSGE